MHVVRDADHLEEALRRAAREAQSYFGRPEVFLERYVDRAHHVEAQIIADTHGNVLFLGERDCSVQRRHQKLIEETPSPVMDEAMRTRFAEAAIALTTRGRLRQRRHDRVHRRRGRLVLLPGDEHAAAGRAHRDRDGDRLRPGRAPAARWRMGEELDLVDAPSGAAIQCRINAEDPGRNFLPGPGRITRYEEPGGPFVRVDSGVTVGREIPGDYDSMFAKLIVSGEDREHARRRMLRASRRVQGGGRAHDDPDPRVGARLQGVPRLRRTPPRGSSGRSPTWTSHPTSTRTSTGVSSAARPADILVEVDGRRVPVRIFDERRATAPRAPSSSAAHHGEHVHGEIRAPMQGTILKVLVEKGQEIRAGEVVCILEAMKMENHIASTRDGEVTRAADPSRSGRGDRADPGRHRLTTDARHTVRVRKLRTTAL